MAYIGKGLDNLGDVQTLDNITKLIDRIEDRYCRPEK